MPGGARRAGTVLAARAGPAGAARRREAMARAAKVDRMMLDANMEARKGYELRASHSEPGLEPGATPDQLPERAGSS